MARIDTLKNFLTDIANKFREKLGTTETISHADYDVKVDEVYEAGYNKGVTDGSGINPEWTSWSYFSANNNRNDLVAKLKYEDTSKGTNFSNMFNGCSSLQEVPRINTSKGTAFGSMFIKCSSLTEIPEMDTSNGKTFSNMFDGCSSLKTINKIDFSEASSATVMAKVFVGCESLKNITFDGSFPVKNDLTVFADSPLLTPESLNSFLNALEDNRSLSVTYAVTIGSENLKKLSDEQINDIYVKKNITLA